MTMKNTSYALLTSFTMAFFLYLTYFSIEKFGKARISTNAMQGLLFTLQKIIFTFTRLYENFKFQYPSVTICPEKSFKTSDFIPYLGTYEDNQDFYLKNVRSLNEVFFFVNQRTRTRPGHKCMTEERSSDRGRPCVFPFQSEEK